MPLLFCLIPLITHFQGEVLTERFIMRPNGSTRKQIYDFVHNRGMKYFCHKFITTTPSVIIHNLFHQNNSAPFLPLHHNARKQFICPPPVFSSRNKLKDIAGQQTHKTWCGGEKNQENISFISSKTLDQR